MFTISKKYVPMAFLAMTMAVSACGGSDDSPGENDCGGCPDGLLCDTSTGVCVGCRNSFDCEAPKAICRTSDHVCVECLNKSDCLEGMTCNLGVCEREQEEAECSLTKPCVGEGETCDYEHGVCFSQIECTPENAATVCPGSECTSAGNCLNSKTVYCDDSQVPENADAILEMVNIAWTATAGWTKAAKCDWKCSNGYEENSSKTGCVKTPDCTPENQATICPGSICVNGSCQTSKKVDCKTVDHGAHSTNIVTQVTITWSSSTGAWTEPAVCEWKCDTGSSGNWVKDGEVCVKAPDCTPDNQATTCPNGGQCGDSGSCITSKSVPCDSTGTPAHATAHQENVTITWTAATGWTSAAACAWDCNLNENYVLNDTRDGCKLNETPTCTPGTCTSNKYCQIDGSEWDCRQEHCEANTSDPAKGGCFECTQASHCGNENDYYCNSNHSCSQYICNSHHSCTGAHQTCDTSAVGGACVMASCSGTVCTDDGYICVDGKYSPCMHGCNSDGTCKSALTGCAAQANPDEWCRSNSEDGDVCDTSSGKCVECMIDSNPAHNTCSAIQTCTNNQCVNNCGNGKLDEKEYSWTDSEGTHYEGYCDNSIPSSQWAAGWRSCTANSSPPHYVLVGEITCSSTCELEYGCTTCGNGMMDEGEDCDPTVNSSQWEYSSCSDLGPRWSGTFSCGSDCKANIDGCIEGPADPCDSVQADEECTSYNNGHPQPCDVYFFGDEGVSTTASIVCKPASATCSSKLVIDDEKTLEVCFPEPADPPTNWCNTQWPGTITAANTDVYGRVPTSAKDSITMKLVYGTDVSKMSTWKSIVAAYDKEDGGNSQFKATMNAATYNALAAGTYYYAMAISEKNGNDWFYCAFTGQQTDHQNDDGSAPPVRSLTSDLMGKMEIQNTTTNWDNHETWKGLSANGSYVNLGKFDSQDVVGIKWAYSGQAYTGTFSHSDVKTGILMNKESTRYVELHVSNGIGKIEFTWGRGGASTKKAPKVKVSTTGSNFTDIDSKLCKISDMKTSTTDPQTGTCSVYQTGSYYLRITPTGDDAVQVIIGDIKWTDYSGN